MSKSAIEIKKSPESSQTVPDVWRAFRNEMDRFFNRFDAGFQLPSVRQMFGLSPMWEDESIFTFSMPVVDITEDDEGYKVMAELPGLDEKDIQVSLSNRSLVLKGEKRQKKEEKDKNHYLSERSYGSFRRSFSLPEGVDENKITAEFSKGVLVISLPKTAEAQKSKKIEIKAA